MFGSRMVLAWSLVMVGFAAGQEPGKAGPAVKEPELARELRARFQSDQATRKTWIDFMVKHKLAGKVDLDKIDPKLAAEYKALAEKVRSEDRKNLLWLKGVVAKHGWPGKSLVGPRGARDAWLLVQHADSDRDFQKACLAKMEALPKGEVEPRDIAYLTDRVLIGTGKKQKYGTQATFKDGKLVFAPIEDEEKVDERRKAVGLPPLAEYRKVLEKVYGKSRKPEGKETDGKP
jgi:hypothetical protein